MAEKGKAKAKPGEPGPVDKKPEPKSQERPRPEKHKPPESKKPVPQQDKPSGKPQAEQPKQEPKTQEKPRQMPEAPRERPGPRMLLFNRWDTSGVKVNDAGLRQYINTDSILVPRTGGKYGPQGFQKGRMSIVERFMNKLMVSGHRGRKHKLSSGRHSGKTPMLFKTMKEAFDLIEKRTKQNPVQVLVTAIENAALLEEVASYRLGGIIARNAVITSPQRRLDLALRHLSQGIFRSSFKSKQGLSRVIAEELISAYSNDSKSFAISERNRIEKEAEGAR